MKYFNDRLFPGKEFAFMSMLAYSITLVATQIYLSFRGNFYSVGSRISASLISTLALNIFLLVISVLGPGYDTLYVPCLILCSMLGVANAFLQTSVFGVAGTMGPEMSQAVMLGLGGAGIVSMFLSLTVSFLARDVLSAERRSIIVNAVMFSFCSAFTILSYWVFFYYLAVQDEEGRAALSQMERQREELQLKARRLDNRSTPMAAACNSPSSLEDQSALDLDSQRSVNGSVIAQVMPQAMNVIIIYVMTMMVFPGIVTKWLPRSGSIFEGNAETLASVNIGIVQVFDTISRQPARWSLKYIDANRLWMYCWLRLLLIPLFVLGQRAPQSPGAFIWASDWGRFLLCAVMAYTNGLFSSWAMMIGPNLVEAARRESAGITMSCCLVIGILIGTMLALSTQIGAS